MAYTFTKNYDSYILGNCGYFRYPQTADETTYAQDDNIVTKKFNADNISTYKYQIEPLTVFDTAGTTGLNSTYVIFNSQSLTVCDGTGTVNYYDYKRQGNILYSQMDEAGSNSTSNNYDLKLSQSLKVAALTENNKHYVVITFQLRNDGNSIQNISEICLAPRCRLGSSAPSGGNRFLMFHEIFDSAVSVGPSEYFTYENKIELPNYRPNKPSA